MERTALITDVAWDDLHRERAILAAAGITTIDGREAGDAELARLAEASDAILTCWRTVDATMLRRAEKCVTIARYGVGGRNLRVFRSSADREAQLLQSILAPALRSRNPQRRKEAVEALENLAAVATHLKHLLLVRDLRKIAN